MTILGFEVPGILIGFALVAMIVFLSERSASSEEEKNEMVPAVSNHQLGWDLRHIRQDLRTAVLLLAGILLTLWIRP